MTAAKTMPLPPPCGTMTVTYGVDKKVKEPVFNESALRGFAEKAQEKDAETIRVLLDALRCLHIAVTKRPSGYNYGLSSAERVALDNARAAIARSTGDAP